MDQNLKFWYLNNFILVKELKEEYKNYIHERTIMKSLKKDEMVYFQNDPANSIYFLKEGKVRISQFDKSGNEFLVAILGKGEIFGEASITENSSRQEAAIVEENLTYCVMKDEDFKSLLLMAPELNFKFSQMCVNNLLETKNRLKDFALKNNKQRIIDFLKEPIVNNNATVNGEIVLNDCFTHQKIAQLTSTNRQEVSMVFSDLRKKQIIDYDRKTIKILDLEQLQNL
ncbi:Crp/Fnr family transcriptional regulator [Gramella sp. AN32]|uniref:Crp/Fnr family transcriptional regulator n=1 Tax=Christiangramia antarctica TaxID=2058158 RepID=A0ABW5X1J2_9FLAO|nr:Crp/Fnr family transcriptional regulator [Gramella sp. AN32]MCM4157959.1 Crp/Fnr family transcriptional regulator [Gramella sp. AN32]